MATQTDGAVEEIKRLQHCINDLVSVLALPAIWSGGEPSQIIGTLHSALLSMLRLDFIYIKLRDPAGEAPIELARFAPAWEPTPLPQEIGKIIHQWLRGDTQDRSAAMRRPFRGRDISIVPLRLGLHGEFGVLVAGAQRSEFPEQTERLVLSVAANQAAIGLQEALLLRGQKRLASELDQRVAQRTAELAASNEELRNEIAERRLTEEKLRLNEEALREAHAQIARSEERWRSVFENSAVGVALADPNGRFIATNPVFRRMLGYTEAELHNLTFLDITVEEDRETNSTLIGELLDGTRKQFQMEKRYRRKNGTLVWVRNNASLVPGTELVPRFLMALSEDITQQRQAEEALRASEHNSRMIIDGIPGLVATLTPGGEVERLNRRTLEFFGKTHEELKNWATNDAVHPDDLNRMTRVLKSSIETTSPYEVDIRMRGTDGAYRWFHSHGLPLRDAGGRVLRWYVLMTDIQDRKMFEDRLRESEALLLEAQRLTHTGSWKHEVSSGELTVSPEIHRIFGSSPGKDTSNPEFWFGRIHPADRQRVQELFQKCEIQKSSYEADYRLLLPDGSVRHQHAIGRPVLSESGDLVEFVGTAMDVTEQVEARIALQKALDEIQKSEAKLRQVIDTIPTLSWCNLPDGPNEFLSKGWHEYTGLPPEESHGWGWQAAFHPADLPALMERWGQLLVSGDPGEIEARLRRHDGAYRWFLIRVEPFRDETGKIARWYGTSTDIEDRKRAEESLRASELSWRQIVDNIPGLVATLSAGGDVEHLNRQTLEYFGKSNEELRNWHLIGAVHPDDLPRVLEARKRSLDGGEIYEVEHRCLRADGVYRWFQVRGLPVRDEKNSVISWYLLLTDIEERKQAEEQLRRSEAFLAEGQRLSRTGSFSWRVKANEFTWSDQLYRIYDLDPGIPVTFEMVRERVHPEDIPLFDGIVERARESGAEFECEHRLLLPDHSVKHVFLTAHGTRDREGLVEYIGAVQDVTQRRLAEDALGRARMELANVARVASLGVLTASIAHEVNQPLSGIITNASTSLRMLAADPPNIEGARETALRTIRDGKRASEVITRLRSLYSGKEAVAEQLDLNEATREVIALSLSELQKNRVIPRLELAEDLPLVMGDRVQLQQVILNLVRNASDAMRAVEDRPRELRVRTECDESDQVRLAVQDTGVGFDPKVANALFEAFYTTKTEGMGMGLSISRSIIDRHNGRLWATTNEGPGATFCFSIPCEREGVRDAKSAVAD